MRAGPCRACRLPRSRARCFRCFAAVVAEVYAKQKKLTIKHEPLTNLDMPAMTMVFVVAEQGMLDKVKTGQAIEFTADRVNGRITVTGIK
ncbi:MAG: hypothetical protein EOS62_07700 [Mesorhizobium sp.]|nr:MAG: hypothetical protein EOS62_07700 [Mesorhizobium sp.]